MLALFAKSAAARFAIEIENQRGTRIVTEWDTFHTGQHMKLHIVSPVNGRIDIVQRWPDGSYQTLYPRREYGDADLVRAGIEMVLPERDDWFLFQEPAGDITLFITFTGTPPLLPGQLHDGAAPTTVDQYGSKTLERLHAEQSLVFPVGLKLSRFSLEINLHQEH